MSSLYQDIWREVFSHLQGKDLLAAGLVAKNLTEVYSDIRGLLHPQYVQRQEIPKDVPKVGVRVLMSGDGASLSACVRALQLATRGIRVLVLGVRELVAEAIFREEASQYYCTKSECVCHGYCPKLCHIVGIPERICDTPTVTLHVTSETCQSVSPSKRIEMSSNRIDFCQSLLATLSKSETVIVGLKKLPRQNIRRSQPLDKRIYCHRGDFNGKAWQNWLDAKANGAQILLVQRSQLLNPYLLPRFHHVYSEEQQLLSVLPDFSYTQLTGASSQESGAC